MRNFKLTLEYDGTDFKGWQIQGNGERTVQAELETALSKIFKKKVNVIGSGRTDSGVHASGQVAHVNADTRMETDKIQKALNANLSEDIVAIKVQEVKKDFHAQFLAKSKIYRYSILNRSYPCAQSRRFLYYYRYPINLSLMRKEAKCLIGKKDFRSFQAADFLRKDRNTIRTIKRITIRKKENLITIDIEANGFLYKMVRNIVGTLLEIGSGLLPKGSLKKILKQKDRSYAGITAPAYGLCLIEVKY